MRRRSMGRVFGLRRPLLIIASVFLLVGLPVAFFTFKKPAKSQAAWFDAAWGFRQRVDIANTSGSNQTDFQVNISTDSASLIAAGKMQTNCNDIRFTDQGGKLLPHWVEPSTCNTSATKIWVKVPNISTSTTSLYFYYGNPTATAAPYKTTDVFIRDMPSAAVSWPLDDTTTTQSYARVINPALGSGRNIVKNGTFDTDISNWSNTSGLDVFEWLNGKLHIVESNGAYSAADQNIGLVAGKTYSYSITVTKNSGNSLYLQQGGNTTIATMGSSNTYTGTFIATSEGAWQGYIRIKAATAAEDWLIDNVVIQQINLPASGGTVTNLLVDGNMEASGTTGWTGLNATLSKQTTSPHSGSQLLRVTSTGGGVFPWASKTGFLTAGKIYRISGYARSDGNAGIRIYHNAGSNLLWTGTTSTTWQPFDVVFVAALTDIRLGSQTATVGQYVEFDDVVITEDNIIRPGELVQDGGLESWSDATHLNNWTFTATTSINQDTTTCPGTSGTNAVREDVDAGGYMGLVQNGVLATGKTYKISFWAMTSLATGSPYIAIYNSGAHASYNTPTLTASYVRYEGIFVALGTGLELRTLGATSRSVYIDDISVTEVSPLSGLPTNGVTLGSAAGGHLTNAYTFDGTNDFVNIYSSDLNSVFNPNEGTIVAWAKVSGAGVWSDGTYRTIVYLTADNNNRISVIKHTASNTLTMQMVSGGTTKYVTPTLSSTGWFQIVLTWSASADQMKAYVNGAQSGTTQTGLGNWAGSLVNTSNNTSIGGPNTITGSSSWSGLINDVRLYSRALSSQEIADMYSTSQDRQAYYTENYQGHELIRQYNDGVTVNASATEEAGTNPIAWWKFDEGQGQTINDASGDGNNGTLGNSTSISYDDPQWATEDHCVSGKCLYFNSNDGIAIANSNSLNTTGPVTLSMWINPSTVTGNISLLNRSTFTNDDGYSLEIRDGKLTVTVNNGRVTGTVQQCNELITANQYTQVQWSRDGSNTSKLYLNGKECTYAATINTAQTTASTTLGIGSKLGKNNLAPYADYSNFTYNSPYSAACWSGDVATITYYNSGGYNNLPYKYMDKTMGGGGGCYQDTNPSMTITDNHTYIVSAWMKGNQSVSLGNGYGLALNRTADNIYRTGPTISVTPTWQQKSWVYSAGTGHAGSYKFRDIIYVDSGLPLDVYWSGVQVEDVTGMGITTPTIGFTGYIDDVKIYNYARTPAQVTVEMNTKGNSASQGLAVSHGIADTSSLSNGLVGYWNMDISAGTSASTIPDVSGNNNTGSINLWGGGNTATDSAIVAGKFGNAFSFDGGDDYVSVSPTIGSTYSISLWFKELGFLNNPNGYAKILFGGGNNTGDIYDMGSNKIAFYSNGGSTTQVAFTPSAWNHVVVTVNGSTGYIYINGALAATLTGVNSSFTNKYIGGGVASRWFDGYIDEVRVYNRVLSAQEVTQLYNWAPGPVGYWKLDERSATEAMVDASGNGYNGTYVGSPTFKSGKYGNSAYFTGTTKYASVTDHDDLDYIDQMTLEFWMKPDDASSLHRLFLKGNPFNAGGYGYSVLYRGDQAGDPLAIQLNDGSATGSTLTYNLGDISNAWTYIAIVCVRSTTHCDVYKNGIFVTQAGGSYANTGSTNSTSALTFGSATNGYNGQLDEVKIYNYARTPQQIVSDMNAGHPAGGSPVSSQLLYWKFDENNGTTTYDTTPNGYNGTYNCPSSTSCPAGTFQWIDGKFNKAAYFHPTVSTDRPLFWRSPINIASTLGTKVTMTLWIKPDASQINGIGWLLRNGISADENYGLRLLSLTNGMYKLGLETYDTTFRGTTTTNAVVPISQWSHIAVVYSQGQWAKFYVNGNLVEQVNSPYISVQATTQLNVGSNSGSTTQNYNGAIDELKIYNDELTADQIKIDMNNGASTNYGSGTIEANDLTDTAGASPSAYWNFEEHSGTTANDTSGAGNNGTLSGTTKPTWTTGYIGGGLQFNGSTGWVAGTNNASVQSNNGTLEAWIKTADAGSSFRGIVTKQNAYGMFLNGNVFGTYDWSTGSSKSSGVSLNDNKWHHVVMTYQSGVTNGTILYVDGIAKLTTTITINGQAVALVAGAGNNGASQVFTGKIDEAKFYNYVRTAAQVAYDYNRGAPLVQWLLDECQGTTANDATGNGSSGTISIGTGAGTGHIDAVGTCTTAGTSWGNGASGKFNSGIALDGIDDYITTNVAHPYSNGTVAFWVKNPRSGTGQYLFRSNASSRTYIMVNSTGVISFVKGNPYVSVAQTPAVPNNTWAHIALTWWTDSGGTQYAQAYYNGQALASPAPSFTDTTAGTYMVLGAFTTTGTQNASGIFDDVRLYPYALSATQIQKIMNGGAIRFGQ